jgi:hypothetical protein
MNWERGIFRVWIAFSLLWIAFTVYRFASGCFYFSDSSIFKPVCDTGGFQKGIPIAGYPEVFSVWDWARWGISAVTIPLLLFIGGLSLKWIAKGFREKRHSN